MLTNLFYYGYYKPYMIKNNSSYSVSKSKKIFNYKKEAAKANSQAKENMFSFYLNKSLKDEVIKYASNISSDFNAIRDTSRFIINRMDTKSLTSSSNAEDFADGIEDFVNQYNNYCNFAEENERNSMALSGYRESIEYRIEENKNILSDLGITIDDKKRLNFNREVFENINEKTFNSYSENIKTMFEDVYNDTCEAMAMPLSQHMNFKNLDYYYNYMYSNREDNTFKIIESGMLVDILL